MIRFRWAAPLAIAALLLVPQQASAQTAPDIGNEPYEWEHFFPIWGKQVARKGIKMPLPWGAGINYGYVNQQVDITNIEVAVNDSPFVDVTELIKFEEVRSKVHVVNARLDLWVFPFLNVYALGLYAAESRTEVAIGAPFQFNAGAIQTGKGGGFGTTYAFGLGGFFGTVDLNWTWNKMQKLEDPVSTFLLTPRFGRNFGQVGPVRLVGWVGAMRQRIGSNTEGSIGLRETLEGTDTSGFKGKMEDWYEGLPPSRQAIVRGIVGRLGDNPEGATIHYKLNKELRQMWNMTLGGEIGLNDRIQFRGEVGFLGRTQVILGFNYRFGVFNAPKDKEKKQPSPDPNQQPKAEAVPAVAATTSVAATTPAMPVAAAEPTSAAPAAEAMPAVAASSEGTSEAAGAAAASAPAEPALVSNKAEVAP